MVRLRHFEDYPRPGITVDLAILTVSDAAERPRLCVLIQDREDPPGRALPGAFVRERRTVAQTTADVFRRKIGLAVPPTVRPRLLRLFDDPRRDDRTWAMSAGHAVAVPESALLGARGDLVHIDLKGELENEESLLFDHNEIVRAAVGDLRSRYEIRYVSHQASPDPDFFLLEPFTLHQLRKVHECVLGEALHKDNFNRRMRALLEPVFRAGEVVRSQDLRGRPAALYRRPYLQRSD